MIAPVPVKSQRTTPTAPSDTCVARTIPLSDALDDCALRARWEAIHDSSDDVHPLLHPDSVAAWFLSGDERPAVEPIVHALTDSSGLRCLGVLDPWRFSVVPEFRWTRSAWRMYGKSLVCAASAPSSVPPADSPDEAARRLPLSDVREWLQTLTVLPDGRTADTLYVEALDRNSPLCDALNSAAPDWRGLDPGPPQPRWRTRLPASVETYWQEQHSARTRNTLRRKRRKLKNSVLRVFTEVDDVPEFLEGATTVSRATWQSRQLGLRIRNSDAERKLYCSLAERGAFRGYLLSVDDRAAAFVITTCHRGTVHYEETGYLPDLAPFSPGLLLVADVIDDLIATGRFTLLDFGLGHAAYKELFANQCSRSEDLWLVRRSLAASTARAAIAGRHRLQFGVRTVLQRTGLLRTVRRWRRNG